jgi:hypothetical protein
MWFIIMKMWNGIRWKAYSTYLTQTRHSNVHHDLTTTPIGYRAVAARWILSAMGGTICCDMSQIKEVVLPVRQRLRSSGFEQSPTRTSRGALLHGGVGVAEGSAIAIENCAPRQK